MDFLSIALSFANTGIPESVGGYRLVQIDKRWKQK